MKEFQSGIIPIFVIAIIGLAALGGGVVVYHAVQKQDTSSSQQDRQEQLPRAGEHSLKNEGDNLAKLEQELTMVLNTTGGIAPERYEEIVQELQQLKERGVEEERIDRVRSLLDQLERGTRQGSIPRQIATESSREEVQEPHSLEEEDGQDNVEPQEQEYVEEQHEQEQESTEPQEINYEELLGTLVLPFEIGSEYDAASKSMGELSFAGSFVITPFAGGNAFVDENYWSRKESGASIDVYFELVPGTMLRAALSGYVEVGKNPVYENGIDPQDWEIHLRPVDDKNTMWVEYDHVVDVRVEDGQFVEQGDVLARAAPASIRHGGPAGEKPVDEFEWGIRVPSAQGGVSLCAINYLDRATRDKLQYALQVMEEQGFPSGENICLVEELSR